MFVALERLINLQGGYRGAFQVQGRHLLLIVVDQRPILMENRCPHQGRPCTPALSNRGCCVVPGTALPSTWPMAVRAMHLALRCSACR